MEIVVALAQTTADGDREVNESKAMDTMSKARDLGAELICFPEMWLEVFFPQFRADKTFFEKAETVPGQLVERFQKKASELHLATVINIYEKAAGGRYYNCSPVIDCDGKVLGISRMMHIPELPNYNETFYYWPGDTDYPVFDIKGTRIGVPVCWDRHFPEQFRILALKGAEVLVIPTAGSLIRVFQDTWETEIQAAAFVNQIFVGIANRVGQEEHISFFGGSFFVNPFGDVIARASQNEEAILISRLDVGLITKARQMAPFLKNRRPETYRDLHKY